MIHYQVQCPYCKKKEWIILNQEPNEEEHAVHIIGQLCFPINERRVVEDRLQEWAMIRLETLGFKRDNWSVVGWMNKKGEQGVVITCRQTNEMYEEISSFISAVRKGVHRPDGKGAPYRTRKQEVPYNQIQQQIKKKPPNKQEAKQELTKQESAS